VPVILEEFKKSPRNSFFGEADDAIVCIRMTAAMTISNDQSARRRSGKLAMLRDEFLTPLRYYK